MLIFAKYEFLWLLLLVPLIPAVYAVTRHLRRKRIRKFGDEKLVGNLMPSWSGAKGWWKIIFFTLAFFFFVLGLARPQLGAKLAQRETRGAEIMICLDVSNSMLAQDYSPDRLSRAKLAISRLVDNLSEDRIGLIIFAGSSFVQLPITTDYVSAKMFLNSINTDSVPIQGTAIGDAILTAAKSFSAQSEKSRAIIVITDGENHEDDPVDAAKQVAETGIKVYTIGVGSLRGQPIPKNGELMKDKDGNIVVTRLDEITLQQVAAAGNGAYVHAGNDEFGLNPILEDIRRMEDEKFNSVVFEEYDEQYMYFFAAALFFLVLELLLGDRRARKKLFTIALAAFFIIPANAQVDRREVRAGNRKFKKDNYKESEIDYRKAVLKDSLSVAGEYNLASSLYRQGDYEAAGKALETVKDAADSPDYHYNVGDVALQKKDYAGAVDAFKKALLQNPGDLDAKENYIYAKKMLENQQNGGGGGSSDDNQDQNQNNDQDQQQDQNNDQNNDQNQDRQNNQNQDQDQQQQDQQISKQQAQQMLNAIQAKEKETQDKVNKEKAAALQSMQKEKNW